MKYILVSSQFQYANMRKPPTKSVTDVQLQIAILLANGMVHEAFEYMRVIISQFFREIEILLYFIACNNFSINFIGKKESKWMRNADEVFP